MNFENVQKIGQKIEVEDKKERENILDEKIIEISLIYALRKLEESPENKDLAEEIENNTPVKNFVMKSLYCYLADAQSSESELFKNSCQFYQDDFDQEINKIYQESGPDIDVIFNFIKEKKDFFDKNFNSSHEDNSSNEVLKLKLFSNNYVNGLENDSRGVFKNLADFGFSKSDKLIELHVNDFYKKDDQTLGQDSIKEDLNSIAKYIVNKDPKIAGVVGRSWLIDTPIAKNIGFNVAEEKSPQNDLSCWLQFVDKNGEINKKRFDKFLESGNLPFKSKVGFIKTEDFLKNYLPKELKGKINLMEIDKTEEEKIERINKEFVLFEKGYTDCQKKGLSFDKALEFAPELEESLLLKLNKEEKDFILNYFKNLFNQGIESNKLRECFEKNIKEHLDNGVSERFLELSKKVKNLDYKTKEVIIE